MRICHAAVMLILITSIAFAQGNATTTGGNITGVDLNVSQPTLKWAAIVGWLNGSAADIDFPVSLQNVTNASIFTNLPNGSYATYFNASMVVTRLPYKPDTAAISTPVSSDFNESGLFANFTAFTGLNYSEFSDNPFDTFCNPCTYMTCYLGPASFLCPYVVLEPTIRMGILKFFNGTAFEPLFVGSIVNQAGFNGTFFDFEYLVPAFEYYYFYIFKGEECSITVWIDGVQTTTFPNTGVPYYVRAQVLDSGASPLTNVSLRAVEGNGRNIFYPIIELGKKLLGWGEMTTDSAGMVHFALSPTRYNIPDGYGYEAYLEVDEAGYYCRQNLSIADYGSLAPTYRTSLVNDSYSSQVKASVQNMNSLASTASKWIQLRKMRVANVTVYTNGTYTALPTLKAGAPNMLNITAIDHNTLNVVNATSETAESEGFVIFVPGQPDKDLYNNTAIYYTNETPVVIPTRYNNPAVLAVDIYYNSSPVATLVFTVDSTLELPAASEADMDDATYSLISSALQNINSVLINIGKSLSTV